MRLSLLGTWAGLALLGSLGCAGGTDSASGQAAGAGAPNAGDGPLPGTFQLQLLSDSPLRLAVKDRVLLRARMTDKAGAPIVDAYLSFALVGRAQDSSLSGLDAKTDQDGVAENTLIAGEKTATFRVRISVPGAFDNFADVAVSNAGFGTLSVSAPYAGRRTLSQRVVVAQPYVTCKQAQRMPGDPMVTLAGGDRARFVALPAGVAYAVTAVGENVDGMPLAQGCVEGVMVRSEAETSINISFIDKPLELSRRFTLEAAFDASAAAATLAGAIRSAEEVLVQNNAQGQPAPTDAEGRFLLDSLDATLRGAAYAQKPGIASLADSLSQTRMGSGSAGSLEHSLQALLDVNGNGPLFAVPRMVEWTNKSLANLQLFALLTLDSTDSAHPTTWQTQRIEALPTNAGASPPALDLSPFSDLTEIQTRSLPQQDVLQLSATRFRALLGALAVQVLNQLVGSTKTGHGDELRALIGCATLAEWLAKQSSLPSAACDSSCVQTACDHATGRLVGAAQTALRALDQKRPRVSLQGALVLSDDNSDLIPDRMTCEPFSGQWDPELSTGLGDAVSGRATATAIAQPSH